MRQSQKHNQGNSSLVSENKSQTALETYEKNWRSECIYQIVILKILTGPKQEIFSVMPLLTQGM